jgi:hypothetical protein
VVLHGILLLCFLKVFFFKVFELRFELLRIFTKTSRSDLKKSGHFSFGGFIVLNLVFVGHSNEGIEINR